LLKYNSENYYIQIADSNNKILWSSHNLDERKLPLIPTSHQIKCIDKDSLDYVNKKMIKTPELYFDELLKGFEGDSVTFKSEFNNHETNFLVKRVKNAVISVGYSTEVIEQQTRFIINILLVTIPIILLISGTVGFFLATLSMRQLNTIIKTVNEIRATNLSRRLPQIEGDDEISRLTTTLNEMIARLERSFSQIRQFTSDASHELKTPLTVMRGELEIALSKQLKGTEYMRIIASSLDEVIRLTNVVENLLELSRADAGNIKLNFEEKSLTRLLVDIIEDAYILADQNQIAVNSHVDPDIVFEFDQVKLHQAILNVIDNAIKYTPKYGTIYIELRKKANYAYITIADSGIGIPKNNLENIFDRFYRVDKSRSSEIKGTGLGLSIVNWIIKAHEGEIDVSSEVNQGTEFSIKMPLNRISPGDPYIPYEL
jgi:heavy metal sensor kinase